VSGGLRSTRSSPGESTAVGMGAENHPGPGQCRRDPRRTVTLQVALARRVHTYAVKWGAVRRTYFVDGRPQIRKVLWCPDAYPGCNDDRGLRLPRTDAATKWSLTFT